MSLSVRQNLRSFAPAFAVYFERRVLSLLFFGFSSGLPLLLVFSTLSAWLAESGVSKTAIGFASLIGTAYSLKFLWSPLVDKFRLPYLSRRLGQRRAWLLLSQIAIILSLLALSQADPALSLRNVIMLAAVVAFSSATQDIAVDAYRAEILETTRLGAGAANIVLGYRIGMLSASTGVLVIADLVDWQWAYAAMGLLGFVGVITTLVNPEPKVVSRKTAVAGSLLEALGSWLYEAVLSPFIEFFKRCEALPAVLILLFVMLYKYSDALLGIMAKPFYLEIGFTKTQIGIVSGGWGLGFTLLGAVLGGVLVRRFSIATSLFVGAILQALSNIAFIALAQAGAIESLFIAVIAIDNISGGLGTTAFVAFLAFLCNRGYSATQYALFSSLFALGRTLFAAGGGWLADQVDWTTFFLLTVLAGLPGLLLLFVLVSNDMFPQEQKYKEIKSKKPKLKESKLKRGARRQGAG